MEKSSWIKDILICILSTSVLILAFISNDRGSIFGSAKLNFMIKNKITITTDYIGINIQPHIDIYNSGKKSEMIGRMVVFLCSPRSKIMKILEPGDFKSFVVLPGQTSNSNLFFFETMTERQNETIGELTSKISIFFNNQIVNNKNYKHNGVLSHNLYSELSNVMNNNVNWIEIGEYLILVTIYGGQSNNEILCQKGYSFRLSKTQVNGLRESQKEFYKIWPNMQGVIRLNNTCFAKLKEIKNAELTSLKSDYEKQPSIPD